VIAAEPSHPGLGPAIDERVLHLVRDDADTVIGDDLQTLGVEVGEREVTDLAFVLQVGEVFERVEVALVA